MCWHVANQVDELVLGTDGRRGKVLHTIVNYWLHLLHVEAQQNQNYCEWPTNNLRAR